MVFILFIARLMGDSTAEVGIGATVPAMLIAAQKTGWNSGNSSVRTIHPMIDTLPGKQ